MPEVERPELAALRAAIEAYEAIPDAVERAKALTELLRDEWPKLHRLAREIRQQAVITMNEQMGMDFPEIGEAIGTDRSRAWRIAKGMS